MAKGCSDAALLFLCIALVLSVYMCIYIYRREKRRRGEYLILVYLQKREESGAGSFLQKDPYEYNLPFLIVAATSAGRKEKETVDTSLQPPSTSVYKKKRRENLLCRTDSQPNSVPHMYVVGREGMKADLT